MHTYDQFGWYSGEADPGRDAGVAPENTSTDTTVGELRANWDGFQWVELEYSAPVVPVPVSPVPASVSMRQARKLLILTGLIDEVEAFLDAIQDPLEKAIARSDWEKSNEVERENPLVVMLGPLLGQTVEQIDDMFRWAATL